MTSPLLIEQHGAVLTVTLNQPERRNPISDQSMVEALLSAMANPGADRVMNAAIAMICFMGFLRLQ